MLLGPEERRRVEALARPEHVAGSRPVLPPSGWFVRGTCAAACIDLWMRHFAPHLFRRLVLTQAFIDDLAQQIVLRPGEKFHLGDELGPYPMPPLGDASVICALASLNT